MKDDLFAKIWDRLGRPENVDLRIMPLGDAITWSYGSSSGSGYRSPLAEILKKGKNTVDFVGNLTSGKMADAHNEGWSGATIDEIGEKSRDALVAASPNVVLLHAGTTDVTRPLDPDNAPKRLGKLIDEVPLRRCPRIPTRRLQANPRAGPDLRLQQRALLHHPGPPESEQARLARADARV